MALVEIVTESPLTENWRANTESISQVFKKEAEERKKKKKNRRSKKMQKMQKVTRDRHCCATRVLIGRRRIGLVVGTKKKRKRNHIIVSQRNQVHKNQLLSDQANMPKPHASLSTRWWPGVTSQEISLS